MTDGLIGAASAAERTLCWSVVVKRYRDLSAGNVFPFQRQEESVEGVT